MNEIKLSDLINVSILQDIQDGFSEYTGMAAIITDNNGIPITKGSGFTRFCTELTRKSEQGGRLCELCDMNAGISALENKSVTVYECHAGLMDYAAPIIVEGHYLGSVIGGQIRTGEVDEQKYFELAEKYGIDAEEYVKAVKEVKKIERAEIEKAARFLEVIANSISEFAYTSYKTYRKSKRLESISKSQADFVMNLSMNLDRAMDRWFKIIDKNMQDTQQEDVYNLLSNMKDSGKEIRSGIKDTIDYIRMSAKDIELRETIYEMNALKDMVENGIEYFKEYSDIEIQSHIGDAEGALFGDVERIGQLINEMVKTLLDGKKQGKIEVWTSAKKKRYASNLSILIMDRQTRYKDEDVNKIKGHFLLLHKMNGSIFINHFGNDMVIKVSIPQLSVQE